MLKSCMAVTSATLLISGTKPRISSEVIWGASPLSVGREAIVPPVAINKIFLIFHHFEHNYTMHFSFNINDMIV
jgi:hypothetical protein